MSPTTRTRARRGEGAKLRTEILDAAERLLVRKGSMDAVSVRGIASAVGVSPPSIYLHFNDKDELFYEVCARRFEEFADEMRGACEGVDDPVERLEKLGRAYVRYGLERPEHYDVLFSQKVIPPDQVASPEDLPGMEALGLLVGAVADGVGSGVVRQVDPFLAAVGLWAQVHGLVMLLLSSARYGDHLPMPDAEVLIDHCLTTAMHGLLKDP